jgi:hypothetical protein
MIAEEERFFETRLHLKKIIVTVFDFSEMKDRFYLNRNIFRIDIVHYANMTVLNCTLI